MVMRGSCELDAEDRNAWLYTLGLHSPRFRVSLHVATMDSPNVRAMFTTKRGFRYVRMLERDFGGYLRARYGEEVTLEIETREMSDDAEEIMQTSVDMVVREKHAA